MQFPLTDRARWAWWLAAVLVAMLAVAAWWPAPREERVVLAPAAVRAMADSAPAIEMSSQSVAAPAAAPASAPAIKLVGTVIAGTGSVATVRLAADAQLVQLRVGDRIGGHVVTAIEPDRIALGGAGQPVVIEADRTPAAPDSQVLPAASPPPPEQAKPEAFAEGQAPWDLAPPFRH
jgi:hypothetical protein